MGGRRLEIDVLGSAFSIVAESDRWAEFLHGLWRDFERPAAAPATEVRVREKDGQSWLSLRDQELPPFDDPWALADAMRYWLVEEAVGGARGVVPVHAAAAVGPAGGALFAGASGAGKTTLALALAEAGWSLGSDDLAPLDAATGLVNPFPKPVSIRGARPGSRAAPPWPPYAGGSLLVPMSALPRERSPFRARWLFFISYEPGRAAAAHGLTPAQAVAALVEYVRTVDPTAVALLTRFCRQATSTRIAYGSTDAALRLVAQVTGGDFQEQGEFG